MTRQTLALVFLLAACGGAQPSAQQIAVLTAENAHGILTMAYTIEAVEIRRKHCTAYTCESADDCEAARLCPELVAQAKRWDRVWEIQELFADAVEAGRTAEAKRLYCDLVKAAPAFTPLPKAGCQ